VTFDWADFDQSFVDHVNSINSQDDLVIPQSLQQQVIEASIEVWGQDYVGRVPYITDQFFNKLQPQQRIMPHSHANNAVAWNLWIQGSSRLVLLDPRGGVYANRFTDEQGGERTYTAFDPVPGRVILFPAWVQHYVEPNLERTTRISVAGHVDFIDPSTLAKLKQAGLVS
jgi:hypothetical protein